MDAVEIGLRLAIEATITGLHRAGVLDDGKLATVLAELDGAAVAARQNIPYSAELVEQIANNVRVMVRQTPIEFSA
ncbi:hypothetical protein [Sphingomonas sp. UYP23]